MKIFRSAVFWLFFVLPVTLGSVYYLKIASNQYESSAHFTIEENGKASFDPLGVLTGLSGPTSSTRDALIIKDFIESREVIEQIKNEIDIKSLYARQDKDWFSRLQQDSSIEEIVEYWQKKIHVHFESSSGITQLTVKAFEPQDTIKIISAILKASERLVNNLSNKARQDSLNFAERELKKAENHLKAVRNKILQFMDKEKALSPEKDVEFKVSLVGSLEADLAKAEAELASLRIRLQENTPKVQAARNRVSSLKKQISKVKARGTRTESSRKNNANTLSTLIAKHEELQTEQDFAEKSYASALLISEQARIDAAKQHRYLTVIVRPQLPEKEIKPDIPHDLIVLFLSSLLFWGISSLVIASIKDHAGWI